MSRPKSTPTKTANIRFRGPLTPIVSELEARLRCSGYTPLTTASLLRLCSHLSRWLADNDLERNSQKLWIGPTR